MLLVAYVLFSHVRDAWLILLVYIYSYVGSRIFLVSDKDTNKKNKKKDNKCKCAEDCNKCECSKRKAKKNKGNEVNEDEEKGKAFDNADDVEQGGAKDDSDGEEETVELNQYFCIVILVFMLAIMAVTAEMVY